MLFNDVIGLDFETYSASPLPIEGLANYVNDPTFKPLLAAVCYESRPGETETKIIDFVEEGDAGVARLRTMIQGKMIAAHNAGFELAVLRKMGFTLASMQFIDTAVLARAAGASGKLEAAAPQLLGVDKFELGPELIKLFSIPGPFQEESNSLEFNPEVITHNQFKWNKFQHYCMVDAELSYAIAQQQMPMFPSTEHWNTAVTMDMNTAGWAVDLDLVEEMYCRYQENNRNLVQEFHKLCDAGELNINSYPQVKKWCAERGVFADSFDEHNIARLIKLVEGRIDPMVAQDTDEDNLDVLLLLQTKQRMGGSSLKKLQVIMDNTADDGRLYHQYLHVGAGATFRTTGRNVQMQNLPRLYGEGDNVEELFDPGSSWNNDKLSHNLRQVFTASEKNGFLIVGDFSSIESRGLAWQANEQWKLDAYMHGKDMYVVQAAKMHLVDEDKVTKGQRQIGKVAELSCGYGAGAGAVRNFAKGMGLDLTEQAAGKLVKDWRENSSATVRYWYELDDMIRSALATYNAQTLKKNFMELVVTPVTPPMSLCKQAPRSISLRIEMYSTSVRRLLMRRVIHGAELSGRQITYYKPSEKKSGDLWANSFTDPATRARRNYTLYGGKLAGIITQSLCREVFFMALRDVDAWCADKPNVKLVGQFHDEIALDWVPSEDSNMPSLFETKDKLRQIMTEPRLIGFPMGAEIKHDYRYTK
jgi:DNA polymerase